MTDRGRPPRRWTYAVVAAWAVLGFVAHLTWRGTAPWFAVAVSAGLAALTITAMRLVPEIRPRRAPSSPPPAQPPDDIVKADLISLRKFAAKLSDRLSAWIDAGLDERSHEHAKKALEKFDAIRKLIDESYVEGRLPETAQRKIHLSMLDIETGMAGTPGNVGAWHKLKQTLDTQHMVIENAVKST